MKNNFSFLLLSLLIPFSVLSQLDKSKFSLDSTLRKWIPSVLDLEVRSFNEKTQTDESYSGTAIFMEHNKKYYLVTARHVAANKFDSNKLVDKVFLIDNLSQKNNWASETFIPFLNIGIKFFEFSNINEDLAIIRIKSIIFIRTLIARGYKPISINDIDQIWNNQKNDEVILIGYPALSWVGQKKSSEMHSNPIFGMPSSLISVPLITQGLITENFRNKYFFYANVSMNHGNSGGPIICNNKLIGIASRYDPILKEILPIDQLSKFYLCNNLFIKSSLIIPLLKKLEDRLKLFFPNTD